MIDDIADVQKCGNNAIKSNAAINTFMEHKKVTLNLSKCHKVHCGKKTKCCPDLYVHKEKMNETREEKYLGDQMHSSAKHATTI